MNQGLSHQATAELKKRTLRTIFWFLAAVLLFNLFLGEMGVIEGIRLRRTAARLEGEVRAMQAENEALDAEIGELRENPYRIEAIARQELGLSRPGEIIFLFPSVGGRHDASPAPPGSPPLR